MIKDLSEDYVFSSIYGFIRIIQFSFSSHTYASYVTIGSHI